MSTSVDIALPGPTAGGDPATRVDARRRGLHRRPRLLLLYHRLASAVVVANVVVLVVHLRRGDWGLGDGSALAALSAMALVNVVAAVVVRQQHVLNALYGLAGRTPSSWPHRLRWLISEVHHVGGVHAGAALAGTAWTLGFFAIALVSSVRHPGSVTPTTLALSGVLVGLLLVVTIAALPPVRFRAHDVFEQTHRWGGWAAIAVFWVLTVHLALVRTTAGGAVTAVVGDWRVGVVALVTASVASPWLRLRRVPITVERPSRHVAIVHLDHGVRPACSSAVGISRRPLREWHPFATITTPQRPGYRLVVSRAGDWTGRFIDDPPSHVWVRGTPVVAPMAKVAGLYERVVYVVTGSGIGPCLGQLLADRVPSRLVWSTRDPRRTYGSLVDEVAAVQPDAVIWDTTRDGPPDLLRLALDAVADLEAEAVFVVSNRPTTLGLVRDLERHGVRAFGPIWDS